MRSVLNLWDTVFVCVWTAWIRRATTTTWLNGEIWPMTSAPGREISWTSLSLVHTKRRTGDTGAVMHRCFRKLSQGFEFSQQLCFVAMHFGWWNKHCFVLFFSQGRSDEGGPREAKEDEEERGEWWRSKHTCQWCWCHPFPLFQWFGNNIFKRVIGWPFFTSWYDSLVP